MKKSARIRRLSASQASGPVEDISNCRVQKFPILRSRCDAKTRGIGQQSGAISFEVLHCSYADLLPKSFVEKLSSVQVSTYCRDMENSWHNVIKENPNTAGSEYKEVHKVYEVSSFLNML